MNLTVLPLPAVPDRTTADPTRWRPERAGIVNVWRYYDETFSFHRGRLLLRGPNGTGKSKALELLLPFLLDASLRPSRLSTFGGQERTMHWNLMGGGYDGKTRSGYVWVEFARAGEGDREWFTLGARLQASVNTRGVTASYFTTRQRVNLPGGLALLGEGSRPLTRGALADAIGPHGRVFDAAGDYRREVMHTLFRGFDADQYEALVFALLQLRTPKLSEHLDPDELSTLLSRSLPPLDQQAVAEIAEGFERLDRRREDLAQLELDVAAATRLADRQRRYAQRVVRAAAADLIGSTTRMDDVTRRARHSRERHDAAVDAQRGLEEQDRRLDAEALDKEARRQALQDSDAYRQGAELDRLRQEAERQRRQAATARRQADQAAAHVAEDHGRVQHAARDVQHLDAARDRAAGELRRAATRAGLEAVWEEAAGADPDQARRLLDAAGDARDHQVAEVRDALAGHQRAVAERDAAAGRLERSREELEAARTTAADRRRDRDAAADGLSAAVRDWAAGCALLALADRAQRLAGLVEDESAILALVHAAAQEVTAAVADLEAQIRARGRALSAERDQLADEHARLQAIRDLAPPPPPSRTADRAGRPGAPLWRLVAFADGVDEPTQAALEAALEDAGLLDAWVAPDGSVAADDGHDRFASVELTTPAAGGSLTDVLVCEPDGAVPVAQVRRLLRAVAWGPTAPEHPAAVGADGSWRLATLVGSWSKPLAEFIGATARERARQRRLADLAVRILELEAALATVAAELEDCATRRIRVAAELDGRPSHAPLRRADEALALAETTVIIRADAVSAARDEHERAERQVGAGLRRLTALASMHRLPTDASGLDRVGDALRGYRETCQAWLDLRRRLDAAVQRRDDAAVVLARSEASACQAAQAAENAERDARGVGVRLRTLESEVGKEYRAVLDEVRGLRDRLDEITRERRRLTQEVRRLEGEIGELRKALQVDEEERETATAARDEAAGGLRRLGVLGLGAEAGLDEDLAALDGVRATLDGARRVAEELAGVPYEPRHRKEAEARLAETVHEVRQALAGRADLSLEPDETGVSVLLAGMDGLRRGARALQAELRAELERSRAELTDYEQELFDRTLTGSTRVQVAERIRHATELVARMNGLLQRVQTASRMRVRLRWQIDPELPAGTREARDLLLRDPATIAEADRAALHAFFRARVDEVRATEAARGWEQQLLDVLDYRDWHQFVVQIDRGDDWQPVTRRTHGQLSGGERAIALHLPLFAAVAAHYGAAPDAPRLILLDEVFVGVDAANRGQLLDLIVRLDLDAVMTSDHEWCTYTELDGIAVHHLLTGGDGDDAVTTARFVWDGARVIATESDPPAPALEPV